MDIIQSTATIVSSIIENKCISLDTDYANNNEEILKQNEFNNQQISNLIDSVYKTLSDCAKNY